MIATRLLGLPQVWFKPDDPPPADNGDDPPGPADNGDDPPGPDDNGDDPPGPVPYDRFQEVINERNKLRDKMAAKEREEKDAKEKELKDKQKWQELYEAEQAKTKQLELSQMRTRIALEVGLPVEMADRLQGDDEQSIREDAKRIAPLLKPGEGPGIPPRGKGGRGGKRLDISKMTPAEIREKRDEIIRQREGSGQ